MIEKVPVYFLERVNEVVERRNFDLEYQLESESLEDFLWLYPHCRRHITFVYPVSGNFTCDRTVVGLLDPGVKTKLGRPHLSCGGDSSA